MQGDVWEETVNRKRQATVTEQKVGASFAKKMYKGKIKPDKYYLNRQKTRQKNIVFLRIKVKI